MADDHNRIRIVVDDKELELEGTPDFLAQYDEPVQEMLERLKAVPSDRRKPSKRGPKITNGIADDEIEGEFGEELGRLPNSAGQTDQMLLAGLFAQRSSEDNAFVTKEASRLLLEQSIKIGNPSQCMTNNLTAKRVFKIAGGKYRVSKPGEEYIATMLGSD